MEEKSENTETEKGQKKNEDKVRTSTGTAGEGIEFKKNFAKHEK